MENLHEADRTTTNSNRNAEIRPAQSIDLQQQHSNARPDEFSSRISVESNNSDSIDRNENTRADNATRREHAASKVRSPSAKSGSQNRNQQHSRQSANVLNQKQSSTTKTEVLLTATDYKNEGNRLFAACHFNEALKHYTKAIAKSPDVAVFFSNRALCYLKLQRFPEAIQDCRRALELDPELIKGHFFLGQAIAGTGNYDEALKYLQCAHELARENKLNFGDDITSQIRLIKRHRWDKVEEDTAQMEDELQNYLVELIKKDRDSKLREFRERLSAVRGEGSSSQAADQADRALATDDEVQLEVMQRNHQAKCDNYTEALVSIFNNLRLQRKKREVPDYLCGKISFEILRDPVVTPSGITYDRQDIEEHLRRVGHFDPITRQPLTSQQLISNLAMKEVVDAYLCENEWANYY